MLVLWYLLLRLRFRPTADHLEKYNNIISYFDSISVENCVIVLFTWTVLFALSSRRIEVHDISILICDDVIQVINVLSKSRHVTFLQLQLLQILAEIPSSVI